MAPPALHYPEIRDSRFPAALAPRPGVMFEFEAPLGEDAVIETVDDFGNPFKIKVARDASWRERVSSLIQRRYAWRGYATSNLGPDTSGRVTLSAYTERATLGTITTALDSSNGLYVERLYPDEIRALRAEGRKLCEFTKLAVDEAVKSKAMLAGMFHVACLYALNVHSCTDALIEVNPRHSRFYQRMLGFTELAGTRLDEQVDAPAVLLRLDLQHCADEIARLGGRRSSVRETRSFYPYFFAPAEAQNALGRLRRHLC